MSPTRTRNALYTSRLVQNAKAVYNTLSELRIEFMKVCRKFIVNVLLYESLK